MSEAKLVIYCSQTADLGSKGSYIFYQGQARAPTGRHMVHASRALIRPRAAFFAVMSTGTSAPILHDHGGRNAKIAKNSTDIWQSQVKVKTESTHFISCLSIKKKHNQKQTKLN